MAGLMGQRAAPPPRPQQMSGMQMRPGGMTPAMAANPAYLAAQQGQGQQMADLMARRAAGQMATPPQRPISPENLAMAAPMMNAMQSSPMRGGPGTPMAPPSGAMPDMNALLEMLRSMGFMQ